MVYESDFYTTRRPYSRPTVTSYSVTNSRLTPAVGKAHTYHPSIPSIAHKKLTNVTTPVPHNQVRRAVINNTLDRIYHKPRSHQSYDPMEDFLNERSVTSFEDVTRSIRANTAALLKQVHTPIPRAIKPLSVSNLYNHTETAISDRISSDEYIWHLLRPLPGKPSNGIDVGYYPESSTRVPLGKTHLACLSYAGSHPISRRRPLVAGAGDDYRNIRNDVELLSHYTRMRQAASLPHENGSVSNETSRDGASRFKYNASTTPHTTEEVIANGPSSALDEDKENIAANKQKTLKKKPSRDISVDEDKLKAEQEALKAKQAEEERLEQEHKAEQERLEQQRKAEQERKAEEERLEQERKAEEERLEQERLAEEERLEQERKAEEERLAEEQRLAEEAQKEEQQRLLEEKLVEEYHREQERLAEEQRLLELQFAEEQQRLAQEKLAEEQKILHDKLMEIKQQQEAEEEVEKEDETEQSTAADEEEKVEENDSEYVTCNNIPKQSEENETEQKNESVAESEVSEDEEPAIAENVKQNGSIEIEEQVEVKYSVKSSFEHHEYSVQAKTEENDDKSENTDANSEISETEEPNNSFVPELNHVESKDTEETQNETKVNKEESEEEEEEEDEEEEEE